jgi:hypothetical protein
MNRSLPVSLRQFFFDDVDDSQSRYSSQVVSVNLPPPLMSQEGTNARFALGAFANSWRPWRLWFFKMQTDA